MKKAWEKPAAMRLDILNTQGTDSFMDGLLGGGGGDDPTGAPRS